MTLSKVLAKNIWDELNNKDYTIADFVEKTNFSEKNVRKILSGKYLIMPNDMYVISSALKISESKLLEEKKEHV